MGQYIVLDLEWNQSPLGKDGSMDRLPFEIIEIGAVKLNASLQIISEFRRLIRPRVYRQMHFKISEVTHMSMDELLSLIHILHRFPYRKRYCGRRRRIRCCIWNRGNVVRSRRGFILPIIFGSYVEAGIPGKLCYAV